MTPNELLLQDDDHKPRAWFNLLPPGSQPNKFELN